MVVFWRLNCEKTRSTFTWLFEYDHLFCCNSSVKYICWSFDRIFNIQVYRPADMDGLVDVFRDNFRIVFGYKGAFERGRET